MNVNDIWNAIKFPAMVLFVIVCFSYIWSLLNLPPQEVLIEILKNYIVLYGLPLVIVGSFFEALLLVGWYFPGSLVIFLSVILAPSPYDAFISVVCVTLGLYCGYTVNFFLGKYGWHKLFLVMGIRRQLEETQKKLSTYGVRLIFLSYWNPGLASFTSTAAGVLHVNASLFLLHSFLAVVLWNIFWGSLVYALGEQALNTFLTLPFVALMLFLWMIARYIQARKVLKNDIITKGGDIL